MERESFFYGERERLREKGGGGERRRETGGGRQEEGVMSLARE